MKIWRPYTQMKSSYQPIHLESADGAYLYSRDGRKIFDGISSWWLITHGHGQVKISEAIGRQARQLEQAVFSNFTHDPAEELSEVLGQFLPKELGHIFFSDNGSTAVEVAMKIAYQYAGQTRQPEKNKFVAFASSYHGDTCGAMSVSGESVFTKPYSGMCFEVMRVNQGHSVSDPNSVWLGHFEQLMRSRGNEVCAVLLEPLVQGAGGMIVWPVEVIQKICDITKQHGALIIFDEVMTGFGRTGTMFAFEQIKRIPDLLCLSKGITGGFLPMGLTITTNPIFEAFLDAKPDKMLFHGHSFTGNALSCAAACANLKLFSQINLQETISRIHDAHVSAMSSLSSKVAIREQRICGTIGVIELNSHFIYGNKLSKRIQEEALRLNLFIRPLGNVLYLMPPYCTTPGEIKSAWEVIGEILKGLEGTSE